MKNEDENNQVAKIAGWTFLALILTFVVIILVYTFIYGTSPYEAMRKNNKIVPLYQPGPDVFSPYLPY
jgi:hypothetical protein